LAQLEHIEAIEKRLWTAADTLGPIPTMRATSTSCPSRATVFLKQPLQNPNEKLTFRGLEKKVK
jgi:hypothetical protein